MRHARPEALAELAPMLIALRKLPGLREKSPGTFYRGSRAFLHFHEDPTGIFADVRLEAEFERMPVSDKKQQEELLRRVRRSLESS